MRTRKEAIEERRRGSVGAVIEALKDPHVGPEGLREATRPLAEELAKSPPRPPLFASANRGPGLTPDVERLSELIFKVRDLDEEYRELESLLRVGEKRTDRGALREHVDDAETCARRAHKLYNAVRLEVEKWLVRNDPIAAKMRDHALSALEEAKASKDLKKTISEQMITNRVGELYPDEALYQRETRTKLKLLVEDVEHLVKTWNSRAASARNLLETLPR